MTDTQTYPFLVNYTSEQARFLENLSGHLQLPLSDTVAAIVVAMQERLDDDEDEMDDFIDELRENRRTPGTGHRQLILTLPPDLMDYVTRLSRRSKSSHSAAVRHLVALFIGQVEEEAAEED